MTYLKITNRKVAFTAFTAALASSACDGVEQPSVDTEPSNAGLTFTASDVIAVRQNRRGIIDGTGDGPSSGTLNGRDIVGGATASALQMFSDGTNVYFRLRLNTDPMVGGALNTYAWGVLIDSDFSTAAAEYSLMVDAIAGPPQIVLARNTSPGTQADPLMDVIDTVVATIPVDLTANTGNTRVSVAGDSNFGGDADYFLDFGISLQTLLQNGLSLDDALRFAAGISGVTRVFNGDVAGAANAPGNGTLQLFLSDATQLDGMNGDVDGDGVPNDVDLDDDQDGIPDLMENFARFNPGADHDSDGIPNWRDTNDRGDGQSAGCTDQNVNGICDVPNSLYDFDGDGIPNHLDLDSDNDSLGDVDEAGQGGLLDLDGDGLIDGLAGLNGLPDVLETILGSGLINYVLLNTDGAELPDFLDNDSDNDGIPDIAEVGNAGLDLDANGLIDVTLDTDLDGIAAVVDVSEARYGGLSIRLRAFDLDLDLIPSVVDADEDLLLLNDSDGDLIIDTLECLLGWRCPDSDNDGCPDYMKPAVDTVAPSVVVTSVAPSPTSGNASISWYGLESGNFDVRVGGTSCATGTVITSGAYSAPNLQTTVIGELALANGVNNLRVCLTDAATNVGTAVSSVVRDVTVAPVVQIGAFTPNPTSAGATLNWSSSGNGTYSVRVGGTNCATGTQVSSGSYTAPNNQATVIAAASLSGGSNTVRVCLTNSLGTTGSATSTVLKDTVAPSVIVRSLAPNPTGAGTAITFTAFESGTYSVRAGGTTCSTGTLIESGVYIGGTNVTTYVPALNIPIGNSVVRACVTDEAGNTGAAGAMLTRSITPTPSVTIVSATPNPTNAGVTVRWFANDAGVSYTLRVGGTTCANGNVVAGGLLSLAPGVPTDTVIAAADLLAGAQTIRLCFTGLLGSASASIAVLKDVTAPAVTISSVSPNPTTAGTTVGFSSPEPGNFEIRVGGTSCSTGVLAEAGAYGGGTLAVPIEANTLAYGNNTLRVCITDIAGNSGSATSSVFRTPPAAITIAGATPNPTNAGTTVRWSADQAGTYSVRAGGNSCTTGTLLAAGVYTSGPVDTVIAASGLVPGNNTIRICVDNVNGMGISTINVVQDVVAPTVNIVSALSPTSAGSSITWNAGEAGSYSLRVGGSSCANGTVVTSGAYVSGNVTNTIPPANLAEGSNTVRLCFTDTAGNAGTASTVIVRDTQGPTVDILGLVQAPASLFANLDFTANESGTFQVRLGSCSAGLLVGSGDYVAGNVQTTAILVASLLSNGRVARVCVTDAAGNTGEDEEPLDTTPPVVTIHSITPNPTASNAVVNWSANENGNFTVRVNGVDCSTGTVIETGAYTTGAPYETTIPAAALNEGSNPVRVCLVDPGLNLGSAMAPVVRDTIGPEVAIIGVDPSPTSSGAALDWDANAAGNFTVRVGGTDCNSGTVIDSGSYVPDTAHRTLIDSSMLVEGPNTLRVCVTDAAGNTGEADTILIKDTTAPGLTIDSVTPSPTSAGTMIAWTGNESGAYSVRVGGTDCSSGTTVETGTYVANTSHRTAINASLLAEGANVLRVCLADEARNLSSAISSVLKDSLAPIVSVVNVAPPVTTAGASLTFHAGENGTYTVRVGGTDCNTGVVVDSGAYIASADVTSPIAAASLAMGTNTLRVCVTDALGNIGEAASSVIRADAPVITIACDALGPTNNAEPLSFRADKNGTYSVRLGASTCDDGVVVQSGSYTAAQQHETMIPTAGLVEGINNLKVCVRDELGLSSSEDATIAYHAPRYLDLMQNAAQRSFTSASSQYFSTAVIGDVTGDGAADLITAEWEGRASAAGPARARAGTLYGYAGGRNFFSTASTAVPAGAAFSIRGGDVDDSLGVRLGRVFAGIDVTGDGVGDIVVSAPYADGVGNARRDAGEVYVFAGGASLSGAIALNGDVMPSQVYARIIGPSAGGMAAILAVRDATGDGIADLLIGVPLADPSGMADAGEVYLLAGGASLGGTRDLATGSRIAYFSGAEAGDTLGMSGAIGDFGGSRDADVALGSRADSDNGGVHGVFGPVSGSYPFATVTADVEWLATANAWKWGQAVQIANVRGDPREDVIISGGRARSPNAVATGAASIYTGPVAAGMITVDVANGYGNADSTVVGIDDDDRFGANLSYGDFDRDGWEDLLISTNASDGANNAYVSAGSAVVSFGAQCLRRMEDLSVNATAYLIDGPGSNRHLGRFSSGNGIGDLDADGFLDFCVAAGDGAGSVYCFTTPWNR